MQQHVDDKFLKAQKGISNRVLAIIGAIAIAIELILLYQFRS